MNIIFGDAVNLVPDSFTVLELDTIKFVPGDIKIQTWCLLDKIPLQEFATIQSNKKIHQDLIEQYRLKNWDFCMQAIGVLMGAWNSELDEFYTVMGQRIAELMPNPPDADWDGSLTRAPA
jgi:hypothetical protein